MFGSGRASALMLALVFALGTFGFSNLDAWLYHRSGVEPGTRQPHYEPAGTTCGHADRCVLGATCPGPRVSTPINIVGRLSQISWIKSDVAFPTRHPDVGPHTLPQPRAPPLPAA